MKGLILKDLYSLKGFQKQYAIMFAVMVIWGFLMKNISLAAIYTIVLGGLLVMSTLSMDETVNFNRYALTMPVSSKTLIKSKYMLLLLTIGTGTVLALIIDGCSVLLPGMEKDRLGAEGILATGMMFFLSYSIAIPVIFKIGIEKGRYVYILSALILTAIFVGLVKIMGLLGIPFSEVEKIPSVFLLLGMAAVSALSLVISYKAAVRVVRKKDW